MKTIHHLVDIDATPGTVFDKVTTQAGLSGWWSTRVQAPDASERTSIHFTFVEGFNPLMQVTEFDASRRVVWTCTEGHEPWSDNTFVFELEPLSDARTRLRFWQHYARELDDDAYGTYNYNWGYYLHSLQELCETGTGHPFQAAASGAEHDGT